METKTEMAYSVLVSTDYDMFKTLESNRSIKPLHLKRLKASMQIKQLVIPIIINEQYKVIDGQHRLQACKDLGLPVYFIITPGADLNDVHLANSVNMTWGVEDYLNSFCEMGLDDYLSYAKFRAKYKFGHKETMLLLQGGLYKRSSADQTVHQDFYQGMFKVTDLDYAYELADKVYQIQPYYSGFLRRCFVYAMNAAHKNKQFDFEHFVKALQTQSRKLVDCVTTRQYLLLIEEIYNYKLGEKNRLRLV